jgi:Zn-dependent metalloprotease
MKEPGSAFDDPVLGKDPQPGHMDGYVDTYQDNGGVHINSGIPNKAFYLAATAIGGQAWEKAGKIWYETIRDGRVKEDTKFEQFASLTVEVALKTPGCGPAEQKAVADAWAQVGVLAPAGRVARKGRGRAAPQAERLFSEQRAKGPNGPRAAV